jgi:hypothetical protein
MATDVMSGLIGPVAASEFYAAPEYAKPELLAWINKLTTLSDGDFIVEATMAIHGSAMAQNYRGNHEDAHCRASACSFESRRRHGAAGHTRNCNGSTLYCSASANVWVSQGYPSAYPPRDCTCGKGN